MRVPRARSAVTAAGLVTLAMGVTVLATGCTPEPEPTPTPTPSVSSEVPPFDTEEEALAVAEAALAEYVAVDNAAGQDGWADPGIYESVAEGDFLDQLVSEAVDFNSEGLRLIGSAKYENVSLQDWRPEKGLIVAYACLDVTGTDVVRPNGQSVVSPDRVERTSKVVTMIFRGGEARITKDRLWDVTDICA